MRSPGRRRGDRPELGRRTLRTYRLTRTRGERRVRCITVILVEGVSVQCETEVDRSAVSLNLPFPISAERREAAAGGREASSRQLTAARKMPTKPKKNQTYLDTQVKAIRRPSGKIFQFIKKQKNRKASVGLLQGASSEVPGHASSQAPRPKPPGTHTPQR